MSRWPNMLLMKLGVLVFIIHAILLLVVIPEVSARMAHLYTQDRPSDGYYELAENLVAGNGYRFYPDTAETLMREPGYPLLLAALLLTFGHSFAVVKLANIVLALLTAWVVLRITEKLPLEMLIKNERLRLAPPLLLLFYPGILVAESRGGVEVLFALLIALFVLAIIKSIQSNRCLDYVIGGGVLGVTVLVRSTLMLFPIFLLAYLLYFESRRVPKLAICRNIAAMIVAMMVVLSPWIIRNYSLTGRFVPTASVLGVSAQAGQYINEHLFEGRPWWLLDREAARERDRLAMGAGYRFADGNEGYYQTFYESKDEVQFSKYLFGKVVSRYRQSPMLFLRCVSQNVLNFWFAGKTWMTTTGNVVIQVPYLVFALIGARYGLKRQQARVAGPLLLFIGYVMAIHVGILAQARYSIPLMPVVSILATIGAGSILRNVKDASRTPAVFAPHGNSDQMLKIS